MNQSIGRPLSGELSLQDEECKTLRNQRQRKSKLKKRAKMLIQAILKYKLIMAIKKSKKMESIGEGKSKMSQLIELFIMKLCIET